MSGTIRFGRFTADLQATELRRGQDTVPLQNLPFKLLVVLLREPGRVVTREQLRQELWPADTFVDFEGSISTAVSKLRDALGDSAANPIFIQTVGRSGYRFIAPVSAAAVSPVAVYSPEAAKVADAAPGPVALPTSRPRARSWTWPAGIVVLALLASLLYASQPAPHLTRIVQLTRTGQVHGNQKLLTDGVRLYFIARQNGRWVAQVMSTDGGAATTLDLPFEHVDLQDISPDGSQLLVRDWSNTSIDDPAGPPLWIAPTAGGAPWRVDGVRTENAAFSSDGNTVLFTRARTVYVCNKDGSDQRKLRDLPGDPVWVRSAPHSNTVRLTLVMESRTELWEMRSDGSHLHSLLPGSGPATRDWGGSWSADGRWFTFGSTRAGGRDIWIARESSWPFHSLDPVRLSAGPTELNVPIFSHSGQRIFAVGINRRGELLRWDPKTHALQPFLNGISAGQVEFSPDHNWVVYVSYPEGALWKARVDGSERLELTGMPMRANSPRWSPDGRFIAFEGRLDSSAPASIYLVPSSGGEAQRILSGENYADLAWSADGKQLFFGVAGDSRSAHLCVYDMLKRQETDIPGTEGLTEPKPDPRGRYLSATTLPDRRFLLIDLGSGRRTELANDLAYPVWSPDGRFIYFNRFQRSGAAMYRMHIPDGKLERLFDVSSFNVTGDWGSWSTLAPDGSVLLLRDLGGVDLYALEWDPGR